MSDGQGAPSGWEHILREALQNLLCPLGAATGYVLCLADADWLFHANSFSFPVLGVLAQGPTVLPLYGGEDYQWHSSHMISKGSFLTTDNMWSLIAQVNTASPVLRVWSIGG